MHIIKLIKRDTHSHVGDDWILQILDLSQTREKAISYAIIQCVTSTGKGGH